MVDWGFEEKKRKAKEKAVMREMEVVKRRIMKMNLLEKMEFDEEDESVLKDRSEVLEFG